MHVRRAIPPMGVRRPPGDGTFRGQPHPASDCPQANRAAAQPGWTSGREAAELGYAQIAAWKETGWSVINDGGPNSG
jgi:hypothetical protein